MTDIFISYKREDRDSAQALAEMFVANGYDVWWDVELLPGKNFSQEINSVVKNAKAAVVLWTPKSIESQWVLGEAALAMNRGILIPVWLEEVELPIPYNTLHTLDLTNWSGKSDDPLLGELLKSVHVLAGEPETDLRKRSSKEIDEVLARPQHEMEFWASVDRREPQSIKEYEAYLNVFGKRGAFVSLARSRIVALREQEKKIKIPKIGTWLAWGGAVMAIAVGAFQIAIWLGWLEESGPSPNQLAVIQLAAKTPDTLDRVATVTVSPSSSVDTRVWKTDVDLLNGLGSLSAPFESSGNPSTIGRDSNGGWSYGSYQITTKTGTFKLYLKFLEANYPSLAKTLTEAGGNPGALAGTEEFKTAWRGLADSTPTMFKDSQRAFIGETHYEPMTQRLLVFGLDIGPRSMALKNVVWSVAVQHGPRSPIIERALNAAGRPLSTLSDEQIINIIYDERLKIDIYFKVSSKAVKDFVRRRFLIERLLAIEHLKQS